MAFQTLIFVGFLAVSLGFTIPEEMSNSPYTGSELVYAEAFPQEENLVLTRKVRSPDGYVRGTFEHTHQDGSSAAIDYNQQLTKNLEVFAGAERNFKYNDNSAHAGLRYTFD